MSHKFAGFGGVKNPKQPATAACRHWRTRITNHYISPANPDLIAEWSCSDCGVRMVPEAEAAAPTSESLRAALDELMKRLPTVGSPVCPPNLAEDWTHDVAVAADKVRDALASEPEGLDVDVLADVLSAALNFEAFAFPVGHPKWREIAERITRLMREGQKDEKLPPNSGEVQRW